MGDKPTSRVRIFIDGEELDIPVNQEIFISIDGEELDAENDDIKDSDWRDFWGDTY